jgi:hypothetical protein
MILRCILRIKTKYNAYWKENIKFFKANDFIAELTKHIPPKLGAPYPLLWPVFQQDDVKRSSNTDVGFVPLINIRAEWMFIDKMSLLLEGDALVSPGGQGRAEDVSLALKYRLKDSFSFKAGYRILEGGTDV